MKTCWRLPQVKGASLFPHDRNTMPAHFTEFIAHHDSPGLILVEQRLPIGEAIDDLLLIWEASDAEEWANRLEFIPL
ncbi:MAG: hypothetical protein ACKVX9_14195 [Blastocatellia bacterium]